MITKEDITRLAQLHSDDGILSAYIKIDPRLAYDRNHPAAKFRSASARTRKHADEQIIAVLDRERDRVLEFLETWQQRGKGLAIFACTPAKIWEVRELQVMVPTWVTVAPTPDIAYLARVIDDYPRLCVVMLDGGEGRIYLGEQDRGEIAGKVQEELPSRHDQGGWSQARYQRHVEFHHTVVLSEVADLVKDTFYGPGFDRLVLVGVEEATKEFESLPADPIRQRVIGHLHADFKQESDPQILERARQLVEEDERSAEAALVEQVAGYADAGGKGALGIDFTIAALIEGRVDTLVVVEGVEKPGSACNNCDYISAHAFRQCPVCSSEECEDVPDVVEDAMEYALSNGSQVNVVSGAAAEMLISRGGIGALLRYPPPVSEEASTAERPA